MPINFLELFKANEALRELTNDFLAELNVDNATEYTITTVEELINTALNENENDMNEKVRAIYGNVVYMHFIGLLKDLDNPIIELHNLRATDDEILNCFEDLSFVNLKKKFIKLINAVLEANLDVNIDYDDVERAVVLEVSREEYHIYEVVTENTSLEIEDNVKKYLKIKARLDSAIFDVNKMSLVKRYCTLIGMRARSRVERLSNELNGIKQSIEVREYLNSLFEEEYPQ